MPTIGIGAGNGVSGQVLVLHDMLDVYPGRKPRFVRNFMQGQPGIGSGRRGLRHRREGPELSRRPSTATSGTSTIRGLVTRRLSDRPDR